MSRFFDSVILSIQNDKDLLKLDEYLSEQKDIKKLYCFFVFYKQSQLKENLSFVNQINKKYNIIVQWLDLTKTFNELKEIQKGIYTKFPLINFLQLTEKELQESQEQIILNNIIESIKDIGLRTGNFSTC